MEGQTECDGVAKTPERRLVDERIKILQKLHPVFLKRISTTKVAPWADEKTSTVNRTRSSGERLNRKSAHPAKQCQHTPTTHEKTKVSGACQLMIDLMLITSWVKILHTLHNHRLSEHFNCGISTDFGHCHTESSKIFERLSCRM